METKHPTSETLAAIAMGFESVPEHVDVCADCNRGLEEFRALGQLLSSLVEPPAELTDWAKVFFVRRRRLEDLVADMATNSALRTRAAKDPQGVLRSAGLDPNEALVELIRDSVKAPGRQIAQRLAARKLWT